jgi:hypothetical protein
MAEPVEVRRDMLGDDNRIRTYTVFVGDRLLISADLRAILARVWEHLDGGGEPVLIFEDRNGRQIDFDFRGTLEEVLDRAAPPARRAGPGRPKLGVVSREVSLLPRHWEWLEGQPSGISAGLRRRVDEARKREPDKERARLAREAAAAFRWGMAGDRPGFEEASRALFAKDQERLEDLVRDWPRDVRSHLLQLTREATRLEGAEAPPAG